jgi:hypothetical protein
MPVLMIALLALAVFGGIGVLLLVAMILETRRENARAKAPRLHEPAVPHGKHVA